MAVDVDVSGLLRFADQVDDEVEQMADTLVAAVGGAASTGAAVAKAWAPRRTGALRDSVESEVQGSARTSAGARGVIRARAPYGWYVQAGTARQAPEPFMDHGREAAEAELVRQLAGAANKVLR